MTAATLAPRSPHVAASARNNATYRKLSTLVQQGATGRLSVGAGSAELVVFLLDGHIVAARASDDTTTLIERLAIGGQLSEPRARELFAMQTMSMSVLGMNVVDPILGLLFEEVDQAVLDDVLGARFEENMAHVVGNRSQPRFDDGEMPWAYNIQVGHPAHDLLDMAADVWDMAVSITEADVLSPGPQRADDPVGQSLVDATGGGSLRVADMLLVLQLPPIVGRAMIARGLQDGILAFSDSDRHHTESPDDVPEIAFEDMQTYDDADHEDDPHLEAFSGAEDNHRGGGRSGTFVTDIDNLDRVELVELDDGRGEPTYSAPTLTDADTLDKIGVSNDVLGVLAGAFDSAKGPGQGSRTIQLLVDGRPRPYIALLDGVQVTQEGTLPPDHILSNLRRRPAAEQRLLLNQGMVDLLDRALDRAADELEEDAFDDILGRVMGYRQRLGL